MKNENGISMKQAHQIADAISIRQEKFKEDLHSSLMVVLLNCGDQFTRVTCLHGEWSGIKADLPATSYIPTCPNGHVLLEAKEGRKQLGWVDAL